MLLDLRVEAKLNLGDVIRNYKNHKLQKTSFAIHEVGVLENTNRVLEILRILSFAWRKKIQTSAQANGHGSQGFGLFFATLIHATELYLFIT